MKNINFIKTRDDGDIIRFEKITPQAEGNTSQPEKNPSQTLGDASKSENVISQAKDNDIQSEKGNDRFRFLEKSSCSWKTPDGSFTRVELKERIEPWLTALFQSEHLSLLVGAGLSRAITNLTKNKDSTSSEGKKEDKTSQNSVNSDKKTNENKPFIKLEDEELSNLITEQAQISAVKAGRKESKIEDEIRTANELLRGFELLKDERTEGLKEANSDTLISLVKGILQNEKRIAEDSKKAFNTLVNFLMSFASRMGSRDRLNIFTTNYDRVIEAGAEVAGLHLLDRFVGNLSPIFRASRLDIDMHYNPPGIRGEPRYLEGVVRFTKLHGSVDWFQDRDMIRRLGIPFGTTDISPFLEASNLDIKNVRQMMIYPNSAKDRETAFYPYVELFRDFAATICRPNSVLVTYGYSFGDEHINRVIEDMLTIPSTHLVMISYDDQFGRIIKLCENHLDQTTLLLGSELGDVSNLTRYYLPKSCIDQVTNRMMDILTRRFTRDVHTSQHISKEEEN